MVRRLISNVNDTAKPVKSDSLSSAGAYKALLKGCQTSDDIFPLTSPGIPPFPPNSAFISHLNAIGSTEAQIVEEYEDNPLTGKKQKVRKLVPSEDLSELVQSALRDPNFQINVEIGPHREKLAKFLPGHLWGLDFPTAGPRPADVMIINKMPWKHEIGSKRCLSADDGEILLNVLGKLKAKGVANYYVTHLVKFMPPDWKTNLRASWVKDCMPLLYQELKIVQPKYILCVGSDVSKALLGSKASVTAMEGKVEDYEYNVGWYPNQESSDYVKTAKIMTVVHPKQVIRDQSAMRQLERGLSRFTSLVNGVEIGGTEKVEHTVIDDYDQLAAFLIDVENDPEKTDDVIAVDAEWHGEHPANSGSYIRTIQFSWKPKHGAGVILNWAGGEENLDISLPDAVKLLKTFFNGGEFSGNVFRPKRVVGHFFNADLEWLVDGLGLDIRKAFACPLFDFEMKKYKHKKPRELYRLYKSEGFADGDVVPAWYRTKFEGGADTGLMCHAAEETASYKLETLAMRYTSAPRYDADLDKWKFDYCKQQGIASSDLGGYGECPDEVLLPYGIYDADVTLRLFYKFDVLIDEDYEGNCCREAFWESQIATPSVLEIHRTGITVDKDRIDILTDAFCDARNGLEAKLREKISWPEFNIRSTQHVKEFLYGHKLNGKLDKETGKPVKIRPDGAMSLNLMPICDTSKTPKPWAEIVKLGKEAESAPSTNKQVLSLLSQSAAASPEIAYKSKFVDMVRDYRFLDQVLKTVLRPPMTDGETDEAVRDDDGNMQYADGLASMCCEDGKVRTHIYQTKETGRWASARPNLQNISKQRDPDYKRLLGDAYKYSLRSVLKASPGKVLLEADYVGAELFGMAVMSQDTSMIEHAKRNQLAENDPDFYDIHSNVAKLAFQLDCPPTKSGLAAIGKKHIRIVAKSVVFGIAYGRGARAIATAAKEQGIDISVEEAQKVIDTIFTMYPRLVPFFKECKERARGNYIDPFTEKRVEHNVICNCYGRFRRFPSSGNDNSLGAEFERQAMNFPIQSMIASAVSRAIAYLHNYKQKHYRKTGDELFKILLQIHDAILFEVPYEHVEFVCEEVLPTYMRDSVPIWPTGLDGMPTGDGPYTLGIEAEVMHHWGEALSFDEASSIGIPTGIGGQDGCIVNYSDIES